jgi:hypothetical protein
MIRRDLLNDVFIFLTARRPEGKVQGYGSCPAHSLAPQSRSIDKVGKDPTPRHQAIVGSST